MKQILIILLFLPSFIFSQKTIKVSQKLPDIIKIKEKIKYSNTLTLTQFAKSLELAAKNGENYLLENCLITYDSIIDIVFFKQSEYFSGDAFIENIHFADSTTVTLINCKFGKRKKKYYPTITFKNCTFNNFTFSFDKNKSEKSSISELNGVSLDEIVIIDFDSIKAKMLEINCSNRYKLDVTISNSNINFCNIFNDYTNEGKSISSWIADIKLDNNKINHVNISDVEVLGINNSTLTYVDISGNIANCFINENIFNSSFNNTWEIKQPALSDVSTFIASKNEYNIENKLGLNISANVGLLSCNNNVFNKFSTDKKLNTESILKLLRNFAINIGAPGAVNGWFLGDTSSFNKLGVKSGGIIEQVKILEKKLKQDSSLRLNYNLGPNLTISGKNIGDVYLINNKIYTLFIQNSIIKNKLKIEKLNVDGYININENNLPDYNSIFFDSTLINFGFTYKKSNYYGNEKYQDINEIVSENAYQAKINMLLSQYRFLIRVYNTHGSPYVNSCILKLKNIETKIKGYEYYRNPNTQKWFNWKGSQFLKWYSDYGMNPFKALSYCFWAIFYFAMFYFFFYSEWDKINRKFLIKKINFMIDYFTNKNTIQDIYNTSNNIEIIKLNEFKEKLNKNKSYLPNVIFPLAKTIYKISLLRFNILNFYYQKIDFMAGKKWNSLQKNKQYKIGAFTFLFILIYITYLVFIRLLNSIVLSINAFSTLGFGQIPVRGFSKYIAIIEGFIGWFMLSVFLVSLLSQMMSV